MSFLLYLFAVLAGIVYGMCLGRKGRSRDTFPSNDILDFISTEIIQTGEMIVNQQKVVEGMKKFAELQAGKGVDISMAEKMELFEAIKTQGGIDSRLKLLNELMLKIKNG